MADSPCILVITDRRDAHVPYVQKHLSLPLVIIDPLELVEGASLTFAFGKAIEVTYKGRRLSNVRSVWYRKPQDIEPDIIPVSPIYKAYSQTAMQRLFYLLYNAFPKAYWLSDYYQLVRGSDKAWQLIVAKRLGLPVPETIITSDKTVARRFIQRHSRTVTKPLTTIHARKEGENRSFFTTLLADGFMPDLTNLHLAPAIFQKAIDMRHDVRVVVVGDRVFAATVHAEGLPASRVYDYRLGHYKGKVVIKALPDFPQELAKLCVQHTRALGINFGALDFGQDTAGNFWFLRITLTGSGPLWKRILASLSARPWPFSWSTRLLNLQFYPVRLALAPE